MFTFKDVGAAGSAGETLMFIFCSEKEKKL